VAFEAMDTNTARSSCDLLWDKWQLGQHIDCLPDELRPLSVTDGYAIQACFEQYSSHPLFGWKIAATSDAGKAHLRVDRPLAGRILAEMVLRPDNPVSLTGNAWRLAEPEFVFRMATDLPPAPAGYREDEVMAGVGGLYLGIELPDCRFTNVVEVGLPQLIADDACAHRYLLGPEAPGLWRRLDLSEHGVHCLVVGRYERDGNGGNVMGDPRRALTWLANELSQCGATLRAGQYVTTGTCMAPLDIEPGDHLVADYGSLGTMNLDFVI
jgi:2-keto-4-pentenoate hydratase